MSDPVKLYWDASCFVCLLAGDAEKERAEVCKDIVKNGELGNVRIYTSMWTLVEVVRPKRPEMKPLPDWAEDALKAVEGKHAGARVNLEALWRRHQADTTLPKLTPEEIKKVEGMFFGWKFIKRVRVDQRVAQKAVELQRDHNLKAADSIHAASAIIAESSILQAWDQDYGKVRHLITVEAPKYISPAGSLYEPHVGDGVVFKSDGHQVTEPQASSNGEKPKATVKGGLGENDR